MNEDLRLVSEINITPLTDVMLVLLIIFMISAPFIVPRGKQIHLPTVVKFETLKSENNILIIDPDNTMQLNGVKVTVDEMSTALENIVDATSEPVNLFIRGDESVNYGVVIGVMDAARTAGVERISLVAEVEEVAVKPTDKEE